MKKTVVGAMFLMGLISMNAQIVSDSISTIEEVELFGERKITPKKLEIITRLPIKPQNLVQNVSVISEKAIAEMGAVTMNEATRNVAGVVLFATYGGRVESMSIRGYRGVPALKNGVVVNSDYRRVTLIPDMQGVESVQIIRGVSAITQGIGTNLGAAGGVINIVTKTPRFINATNVGFRYGSWDTYRPTLDFQRVLDKKGMVAVRFNMAYQNNKSFADYNKGERVYVNPSVAFRPDDKTNIVAEMDFLYNERTPNRGTVNLADDNTYAIYDLPKNKFLGFASDYMKDKSLTYMISADRKLSDKLKIRAAFIASDNEREGVATGRLMLDKNETNYAIRQRSIARERGIDKSKTFQFDFIGKEIQTGILKHTFQLGFDWKTSELSTYDFRDPSVEIADPRTKRKVKAPYIAVDKIDVTKEVNNILPSHIDLNILKLQGINTLKTPTWGVMAQEVLEIGKHARVFLGIRYSKLTGESHKGKRDAWNPSFGLMFSPKQHFNIYASYTTSTDLRSNHLPLENGGTVGSAVTRQWEAGVKTDWFDEKLKFNVNLYHQKIANLSYNITDIAGKATKFYGLAGDLTRKGVEIDLIGKILPELEIMAGYAYIDAQYQNSPSFVDGARPFMMPNHTANAWLNYKVREGALQGFNIGGGVYYIGERPINESVKNSNVVHDTKSATPFMLKAFTTINAQIGYTYRNASIKIFANNLTDSIGYEAYYRGGFLNRMTPRHFAVQLNYKF
ncbi:MAG: TonB-dependent receptor [Flavobacteriaceae bacterium]|nr:TonB-dependent receptor [Flavobacteriaceae bacterium]